MKRLPGIGIGLALLAQLSFTGALKAQPVGLTSTPHPAPLGRQSLVPQAASRSSSSLYDTSLVLSNMAHLTSTGDTPISSSASDRPTLGYMAPAVAISTPTIDPFFSTSLGRLNLASAPVSFAAHSSLATATAAPLPAAHQSLATSTNWRLGSRFLPPTTKTPVLAVPGKGDSQVSGTVASGTSSLGRGTLVLGGSGIPIVGVPEPSTYLLCGAILVLAGYCTLRRREKVQVPTQPNDTIDLSSMTMADALAPESAH